MPNPQIVSSPLVPGRPFALLAALYLTGLILFALWRAAFLIYFSDNLSGVTITEVATCFLVGARFDQIVILYLLLPLILIFPWINTHARPVVVIARSYLVAVTSTAGLLLLADIRFFELFGVHLNFLVYEYLSHPDLVWHVISSDSAFVSTIALWLVLIAGLSLLSRWPWRLTSQVAANRHWWSRAAWMLVLVALAVVGIRGRVELSPIDWGAAYFSRNHTVNQAALNGIYTLARNYTEDDRDERLANLDESRRYPFVSINTAVATVRQSLTRPGDRWSPDPISLERTTNQAASKVGYQPNVVVVIMESWGAVNTGALGSPRKLTPHFDSLAGHGILFDNFHASGVRTSFGLLAILGSFPALPGRSIMGRYDASHPFVALSEILHDRGYYNGFLYGGDLVFDNMQGFFRNKGYDRFWGEDDFEHDRKFSKWGVPDHLMFERCAYVIDSLPRPFQLTVLTLSNHEPWDLPDSSVRRYLDNADTSKIFNAQLYADWALGGFMETMRDNGVYDSTIFVFTADHARYRSGRIPLDPQAFRVPLLIVGPQQLIGIPRTSTECGSQVDITPTIMGLLGNEYSHSCWGRDLLDTVGGPHGVAWITAWDRIGMVTNDHLYTEWLGRDAILYSLTEDSVLAVDSTNTAIRDSCQLLARRFYQAAEQLRDKRFSK